MKNSNFRAIRITVLTMVSFIALISAACRMDPSDREPELSGVTGKNVTGPSRSEVILASADFQGDKDAIFIFQIGSTLPTMAESGFVAITTGGDASGGSNVYWCVGSSAAIGGGNFMRTVAACTSIPLALASGTESPTDGCHSKTMTAGTV